MTDVPTYIIQADVGPGDTINLPFEVASQDEVVVEADGTEVTSDLYTWTGAAQITAGSGFPPNTSTKVYRNTPVNDDDLEGTQADGGYYDARLANDLTARTFRALQEHRDALELVPSEELLLKATEDADRAEASAAVVWSLVGSGATLDGTGDDLAAVQLALNLRAADGGGKVTTGGRSFRIVGRLRIPDGVKLVTEGGWIYLGSTTSGVDCGDSYIDAKISAAGVTSFSGPALCFADDGYYNRQSSYNAGIGPGTVLLGPGNGLSASGEGLRLKSGTAASTKGVTGIIAPRLRVLNFHTGIRLWAEGSGCWVNSNEINATIYGCVRMIHLNRGSGGEVNGNRFMGDIQPNTGVHISEYGVRDEGVNNCFILTTWDWNNSGSTKAYDLEAGSAGVILDQVAEEYIHRGAGDGVEDYTVITMSGTHRPYNVNPTPPGTTESASFTPSDDFLVCADELFTVTTTGDTVTNIANAFRNDANVASCTLTSTGLTVQVDLGEAYGYLMGAAAMFGFGLSCSGVKLEWSLDGSAWTAITDQTANANHIVGRFGKSFLSGSFRYLRWTFTGAGTTINIQRLFAFSPAIPGNVWLSSENTKYLAGKTFYSRLASNNTLADSASAQALFPSGQGTIAVAASSVYEFEMVATITRSAGTTAHTVKFLLGGTATLNNVRFIAMAANPDGVNLDTLKATTIPSANGNTVTASNSLATETILLTVKGEIQVTGAGTIIPQIQYSAAPGGAPSVLKGSFVKVTKTGAAGFTSKGPWT